MLRFPIFLCLLLAGVTPVRAHPDLQNAMWMQYEPGVVAVAVNVSVREIAVAQGLATGETVAAETPELRRGAEAHRAYLPSHLSIRADMRELTGTVRGFTAPARFGDAETTFYQYDLIYRLPEPQPTRLEIEHRMLQEWPYAPGTAWDISYTVRAKRSDEPAVSIFLLTRNQPASFATGWGSGPADVAAPPGSWRLFADYVKHGCHHILTGYDHLLFAAVLVIATLSLWEMVKVIAAFTLAHTLTLALSAFGLVRLPAAIVEPVIALSIVFVALENVFRPQRARSGARLAVAFGFGLVHGLGFAGGLLEAMQGLPSGVLWLALIAFSLGVEIGHQIAVLPLFGLLKLSQRRMAEHRHPALLRAGSAVIACAGLYFLVGAIREQFFAG